MNLEYLLSCAEHRLYDYKTKVPGFPEWQHQKEVKEAYRLGSLYGDYFV
jgi:hypothetical protein